MWRLGKVQSMKIVKDTIDLTKFNKGKKDASRDIYANAHRQLETLKDVPGYQFFIQSFLQEVQNMRG